MSIDPELLVRIAKKWSIRRDVALEVIRRDLNCVYCRRDFHVDLSGPRAGLPTWEHIVNDLSLVSSSNIALCCWGCNASKGRKTLEEWLQSRYCQARGISSSSIAFVAANALQT
jgi:hypothetical protein